MKTSPGIIRGLKDWIIGKPAPVSVPAKRGGVTLKDKRPTTDLGRMSSEMRAAGATASGGTGDYHIRYDREFMVNLSRQMDRDNYLSRSITGRLLEYVLGPEGFKLQPDEGLPEGVQRTLIDLWKGWYAAPEVRQIHSGQQFAEIILRELFVVGDTLLMKQDTGLLQHIESERIRSNKQKEGSNTIEQGVVLNPAGQIVGFKVGNVSRQGSSVSAEGDMLKAENAFYLLSRPDRSSQTRGVPALVSSMPVGWRLEDIITSEAVAAQVLSRIAIAITNSTDPDATPITASSGGETRTDAKDSDADTIITELGLGIIFQGGKDQELKGINQNRPNANFEATVRLFIQLYSMSTGFPVEIIMMTWGKANFSSSRAILNQGYMAFRRWQKEIRQLFYDPIYVWQVGRWIAEGKVVWRPGIFKHTWDVPDTPWIDADKEVSAAGKMLDRGMATQKDLLAKREGNVADYRREREKEYEGAWEAAKTFSEFTNGEVKPIDVWKSFAGIETGKTESAVRTKTQGTARPATEDDDDKGPDNG